MEPAQTQRGNREINTSTQRGRSHASLQGRSVSGIKMKLLLVPFLMVIMEVIGGPTPSEQPDSWPRTTGTHTEKNVVKCKYYYQNCSSENIS